MQQELGMKVKSELFKRGISQKKLAEMLGVSGPYLSDIINGRRTGPKAQEHVKHIKRILNL